MVDSVPNSSGASRDSDTSVPAKRTHSYGRFTTAIAVLALATGAYSLLRLDSTRDRIADLKSMAATFEADRNTLRSEIATIASREQQSREQLERRIEALGNLSQQVQEMGHVLEELKGRSAGPERAWSRAEATFLLELAQRRLVLDRDVQTALVALESADTRLAALRDPSFSAARQQIAKDLQALRSVRVPDITGILAHLSGAEEQALSLPVKGIVVLERAPVNRDALPEGTLGRAWALVKETLRNLITMRRVDNQSASVVTAEEQLLRRQHLQLLLFSARTAAARRDEAGYRNSLASARRTLGEFFDLTQPASAALLTEIQTLEAIDIDPQLPDLSASLSQLQRMTPVRSGPE